MTEKNIILENNDKIKSPSKKELKKKEKEMAEKTAILDNNDIKSPSKKELKKKEKEMAEKIAILDNEIKSFNKKY